MTHTKRPGAPFSGDPRDTYVAPEDVNDGSHYVMYSVFSLEEALSGTPRPSGRRGSAEAVAAVEGRGVSIRGWYDVAGFRADADLMVWLLADDPTKLQAAYHALRAQPTGRRLVPVWSNVGVHRPAEFNASHTPSCFSGIAPRPWLTVYPFVRSYEWYSMDAGQARPACCATTGWPPGTSRTCSAPRPRRSRSATTSGCSPSRRDDLTRLVDAMRAQRAVEARLHVREETPFFTGPRVSLADWAGRQIVA